MNAGCGVSGVGPQVSGLSLPLIKLISIQNRKLEIVNRKFPYIVFTSKLRHKYQHATDLYGSQHFAIFSICAGLGILRLR